MLLDDFKALLWAYGGNLGRGSGHADPEAAGQPELFLLAASNFISSDARIATCIFNLVIEMASKLSQPALEKKMQTIKYHYDVRRLGVLISIVRDELRRRGELVDAERWSAVETSLRRQVDIPHSLEPLISHLPSLPGRRDPLFSTWGFEYPGVVREPAKYLRKAV